MQKLAQKQQNLHGLISWAQRWQIVPAQRKKFRRTLFVFVSTVKLAYGNKFDSSSMFEYFEKGTEPTEYITERFNDDICSTHQAKQ
ncbi:hypothetical protein O9993_20340 [Vibrio lentus]|nr:hypothetical protein [Vibrio lentus]